MNHYRYGCMNRTEAPLTSNHQNPNPVNSAEQNQAQHTGSQHAHPPQLLAQESSPLRRSMARLHDTQEMVV